MIEFGGNGIPLYITFDKRKNDKYKLILTSSFIGNESIKKTGKTEKIIYKESGVLILALPKRISELIFMYEEKKYFFELYDAVANMHEYRRKI